MAQQGVHWGKRVSRGEWNHDGAEKGHKYLHATRKSSKEAASLGQVKGHIYSGFASNPYNAFLFLFFAVLQPRKANTIWSPLDILKNPFKQKYMDHKILRVAKSWQTACGSWCQNTWTFLLDEAHRHNGWQLAFWHVTVHTVILSVKQRCEMRTTHSDNNIQKSRQLKWHMTMTKPLPMSKTLSTCDMIVLGTDATGNSHYNNVQ